MQHLLESCEKLNDGKFIDRHSVQKPVLELHFTVYAQAWPHTIFFSLKNANQLEFIVKSSLFLVCTKVVTLIFHEINFTTLNLGSIVN